MLNRYRKFLNDYPLLAWFVNVACLLACFALLHEKLNPHFHFGMTDLAVYNSLSWPTLLLVWRFSETHRCEYPIAPRQEKAVALVSVIAGVSSILALGFRILCHRLCIALPEYVSMGLLPVYSVALLLAFVFGYVSRDSRVGKSGLLLATVWLLVLLVSGYIALARG